VAMMPMVVSIMIVMMILRPGGKRDERRNDA